MKLFASLLAASAVVVTAAAPSEAGYSYPRATATSGDSSVGNINAGVGDINVGGSGNGGGGGSATSYGGSSAGGSVDRSGNATIERGAVRALGGEGGRAVIREGAIDNTVKGGKAVIQDGANRNRNLNTVTGGDQRNVLRDSGNADVDNKNVQGQAQGIYGSGNSTNDLSNDNSNSQGQGQQQGIDADLSNRNRNRNNNSNSQGQGQQQGQGQGQDQGQDQSQSANNRQSQSSRSTSEGGDVRNSGNSRNSNRTSSRSSANNRGNRQTINQTYIDIPEATVAPLPQNGVPGQVGDVITPLPSVMGGGFATRDNDIFGGDRTTSGVTLGFQIPLGTGQTRRAAEQIIARREAASRFQLIQEATWMLQQGVLSETAHPEHWAALYGTESNLEAALKSFKF